MLATTPIDNVMGVLGLPLAFAVTGLGIGLFIERVVRARLPNALLIPVGTCGSIIVSLLVYWTGSGDVPAIVVTVALTIAGGVFAQGGLRSRLNPGWPGVAALATYVLFVAPELLTGHWTWSGYNFLNDTSTQFVLTSYMKTHGTMAVGLIPPKSTSTEFVRTYLATSYPLGSHALLGTLSGLLRTGPSVLYQGYLAALAAVTAMSLATLSGDLFGPRLSALAGFVGAAANLTYQYALQGSVKEIATLATFTVAIAVSREVAREGVTVRRALMAAVPFAALIDVYYAAALPFAAAAAAVAVVAVFVVRRKPPDRRMIGALVLGSAATVALAAPAVGSLINSFNVVSGVFGAGPTTAGALGQLLRRLPLSEVSGVWLQGDYRTPVSAGRDATITSLAAVLIFGLALLGVVLAMRRGEIGPAMLVAASAVMLVLILPRVTPYAGAKALAIASPAAAYTAFVGALAVCTAPRPRWMSQGWPLPAIGAVAAACVGVAVLASDAIAYHYDNVAPTPRMLAIKQVGKRFAGRGLILWNEFEEYAKYFALPARINVPTETLTPRPAQLIQPNSLYGQYYDLDAEQLSYVESFPVIVMRRSPSASRPPANYRLAYSNSYYQAWVREPGPTVLRHLSVQTPDLAAGPVDCAALQRFVQPASPGSELVAAIPPAQSRFIPVQVVHPPGWPIDGGHPDALTLVGPGVVAGKLDAPRAGRYELWVQGSFQRPIEVRADGRRIRTISGIDTPGQWFPVAALDLRAGPHYVALHRGHGSLSPGVGGAAFLGPVALAADQPERLEVVSTRNWRSLCGRTADWIELVRR